RGWELLAGALACLAPALAGGRARAAETAGYALIAGSLLLIGAAGWPDVQALAPVAGTVLVILARRAPPRPVGQGLAAWIGLASYSLYLWHWPVVVGLRYSGREGDWRWAAAGIAATFLLGHLSWRFVERRTRPASAGPHIHVGRPADTWRSLGLYALAPLALVLAGLGIGRTHGLPQRYPPAIQSVVREAAYREVEGAAGCYGAGTDLPEPCRLGPRGGPLLATFLGDSHADAELPGLIEALPPAAHGTIAFNALAGCAPMLGARSINRRNACGAFNARFVAPLAEPRKAPLVLSANWVGYLSDPPVRFAGEGGAGATSASFGANLMRSSCALAAGGPVYIVLPTPLFPSGVANELQRRLIADPKAPDVALPRSIHEARIRSTVALLREAASKCGVRLLDPTPYLCPAEICPGSLDHHPLYRDNHHLTRLGARRLAPLYRQVFADGAGGAAR
ncbi:MAG: acyltransferase family protein, partial [Allosphingosinicella sp.]